MLELKTVFIFTAVINLCTVAAVTVGWFRSPGRDDMRFWLLAAWLMVAGSIAAGLGGVLSQPVAGYAGGLAYMVSTGCLLLGFKAFFGLSHRWYEAVAVALVAGVAIAASHAVTAGTFDGVWLVYAGSGANLVMITLTVWRGRREEVLPSRHLAVAVTAAYALCNFAVAPLAWFYPLSGAESVAQAAWLQVCAIPLIMCNVATYVVVLVLKLERATESQRFLATRDMLTGVLNRRAFYQELAALSECDGSIGVLDLDHFKAINDSHGHKGGDDVLRAFACCVEKVLPKEAVFGRTGGEEFAVCLPGMDEKAAGRALEKVRAEVERLNVAGPRGGLITFTVSCGHSAFRAGAWSIDQTIAEADIALYQAKNAGRNRVEAYAPAVWLQRCIEDTLATLSASARQ